LELSLTPLDRRRPGTSLPPQAYRVVGVAKVSYAHLASRWSSDDVTLERLVKALSGHDSTGKQRIEAA